MNIRAVSVGGLLLVAASGAWAADDTEMLLMMRVRLSTDPSVAAGCTHIGPVSDDSPRDLRRKIVRVGGNTAVLSFGVRDLSMIYAEVYRCTQQAGPAPVPSPPPRVPPPPPGPPPPPPPPPSMSPPVTSPGSATPLPPPPPGPPPPPPPSR